MAWQKALTTGGLFGGGGGKRHTVMLVAAEPAPAVATPRTFPAVSIPPPAMDAVILYRTLSRTPHKGLHEIILPGAFDEAIESNNVQVQVAHRPDLVLADRDSGTLELTSGPHGLSVRFSLVGIDRALGHAVAHLWMRKRFRQLSCGSYTERSHIETRDGQQVRIVEQIDIHELSVGTHCVSVSSTQLHGAYCLDPWHSIDPRAVELAREADDRR